MGMSTPLAVCPERTFACVPRVWEPGELLLLRPQASLISELWLMCTSHKTSLLCNLPNHRLSIHHRWRGGWKEACFSSIEVSRTHTTWVQHILLVNHTTVPNPEHLTLCVVSTDQGPREEGIPSLRAHSLLNWLLLLLLPPTSYYRTPYFMPYAPNV